VTFALSHFKDCEETYVYISRCEFVPQWPLQSKHTPGNYTPPNIRNTYSVYSTNDTKQFATFTRSTGRGCVTFTIYILLSVKRVQHGKYLQLCVMRNIRIHYGNHLVYSKSYVRPIPVAARSKACVCGRSLAGICGFESHRGHGCLSVFWIVACCQVEVPAAGRSTVQRSPTQCACVRACVLACALAVCNNGQE
jgi:hypothetical protein